MVLQVCVIAVFAVLGFSFWFLQIVEGDAYVELAENNNQRTMALRAPRGIVFDRDMKLLVDNRLSFTVSIDRKNARDIPGTIRLLSAIAGLDPQQVQQAVDRRRREPSYQSIPIIEDATLDQVAADEEARAARGVARSVEHPDAQLAEREHVAVAIPLDAGVVDAGLEREPIGSDRVRGSVLRGRKSS